MLPGECLRLEHSPCLGATLCSVTGCFGYWTVCFAACLCVHCDLLRGGRLRLRLHLYILASPLRGSSLQMAVVAPDVQCAVGFLSGRAPHRDSLCEICQPPRLHASHEQGQAALWGTLC